MEKVKHEKLALSGRPNFRQVARDVAHYFGLSDV
jgi:hypothetical protein